jgi:Transposase
VFCGIDWAEDHHDVALVNAAGTALAKLRISDGAAGIAALTTLPAEHGDCVEQQIPVAMETNRGLLVACLRAIGCRVYAINPLAVARHRRRVRPPRRGAARRAPAPTAPGRASLT